MKKLDVHKLFSIFEQGDEEVYREHGMMSVLNNPFVLLGMVTSGMSNFFLLDEINKKRYPQEYSKARDQIMYNYFSRLYGYLKRVNVQSIQTDYYIGESYDLPECHKALNDLRMYFESIEHYEKCASIKIILDSLYDQKKLLVKK